MMFEGMGKLDPPLDLGLFKAEERHTHDQDEERGKQAEGALP